MEEFADCAEDLKRVILESNDVLIPRKACMMPVGASWKSRPGVKLVRDAAHLMTPFAGVGVNIAVADALDLAKAPTVKKESKIAKLAKLVNDGESTEQAIEMYELFEILIYPLHSKTKNVEEGIFKTPKLQKRKKQKPKSVPPHTLSLHRSREGEGGEDGRWRHTNKFE